MSSQTPTYKRKWKKRYIYNNYMDQGIEKSTKNKIHEAKL